MAHTLRNREYTQGPIADGDIDRVIERFAQLVENRLNALARETDRKDAIALVRQALNEARISLQTFPSLNSMPAAKLKASDVISQGLVSLSQASLYRAAENGRFYFVTPKGRTIGREFPAWQFVEPVPELIEPVLRQLEDRPSSEIHAFWVGAVDEINELSPAELLAGRVFDTRHDVHKSQQRLLDLPAHERLRKVQELAELNTRGMADLIG